LNFGFINRYHFMRLIAVFAHTPTMCDARGQGGHAVSSSSGGNRHALYHLLADAYYCIDGEAVRAASGMIPPKFRRQF